MMRGAKSVVTDPTPPPSHDAAAPTQTTGVVLLLLGAVAFSSAGFFVRAISVDVWTLLCLRGVFTGLTILAFIVWRERGGTLAAFRAVGWPGIALAVLSVLSMICYLTSLRLTSVANNSIIFGTSPFVTAAMAWALIGERPSATTLVCAALALGGVALVFGGSVSTAPGHVAGDILAFAMTVLMAGVTVLVRRHRDIPMVPAACLSAFLAVAVTLPLASPLTATPRDLGLLALFGLLQQGLGLIFTTIGQRHVPAARSALIAMLDLPLAPLWVWLAFAEVPGQSTAIGGGIVLMVILAHVLIEQRRTLTARQ